MEHVVTRRGIVATTPDRYFGEFERVGGLDNLLQLMIRTWAARKIDVSVTSAVEKVARLCIYMCVHCTVYTWEHF